MDTFDHLLNWKLKRGSHPFPGPNGGTCINEAALIATGFEYKPITAATDMPECFSRPICHLAMVLNDGANDDERQRLLPYVTRLACADTREFEERRTTYINERTRRFYIGIPFDEGLKVLDGALAIGRQADPLLLQEVRGRMDQAKAEARTSEPEVTFFSKVKSWLTMKESESAA